MSKEVIIAEVVSQSLDAAKGSPDMRAAGRALAKSTRILAETLRSALMPLAIVNLGVRQFEDYLRKRFPAEFARATSGIRDDNLQEPPLNIAGPVVQGLAYAFESEDLRKMFLALLATAMDRTRAGDAHPAFAEVIRQLDPSEAVYLDAVLRAGTLPAVQVRQQAEENSGAYVILQSHIVEIRRNGALDGNPRLPVFVENWARLGLIEARYDRILTAPGSYDWVGSHPAYAAFVEEHGSDKISYQGGGIMLTPWGEAFAESLGLPEFGLRAADISNS